MLGVFSHIRLLPFLLNPPPPDLVYGVHGCGEVHPVVAVSLFLLYQMTLGLTCEVKVTCSKALQSVLGLLIVTALR